MSVTQPVTDLRLAERWYIVIVRLQVIQPSVVFHELLQIWVGIAGKITNRHLGDVASEEDGLGRFYCFLNHDIYDLFFRCFASD